MKRIIIALALLAISFSAMAQQNVRTSYFMDTYAYSYRFNPSFIPRNDHVSIGIGNVGFGMESNVVGDAVLSYDEGNGSYDIAIAGDKDISHLLKDRNRLNVNAYEDLLSVGFHAGKFFHSVDFGFKADFNAVVPGSLYDTMNSDFENKQAEYHLRDFDARMGLRYELAYGIATRLGDRINVGGRAKLQFAGVNMRAKFNSIDVFVNDNIVDGRTDGYFEVNVPKGVDYREVDGELVIEDSEEEFTFLEAAAPAGFGLAFDLGSSMKVTDNLTVSLAVNDLGFMKWGNALRVQPGNFIVDTDESESEEEDSDFQKVVDNMPLTLVKTSGLHSLRATVVAGAEYAIPGAKGLSAGFVGTAQMAGLGSWTEGRVIMNYVAPYVLEVALSGAVSTFGASAGLALSLDLGPINIFAGFDSLIPLFTMDNSIPTGRLNTNASLGLSIIWGRNRIR